MNSSPSGSHSLTQPIWYIISDSLLESLFTVFCYHKCVPWPWFDVFFRSSLWLMMLNLEHQLIYPGIMPASMFLVEVLCQLCFWAAALPHYLHEARLLPLVSRGKGLALLRFSLLSDQSRNQSGNSFLRFVLTSSWSPNEYNCIATGSVISVWYVCSLDWPLKQIAS